MTSLLTAVDRRLRIHARRRVRTLLDGQYGSVHKGRSHEFDDLREYIPGDDVKDIDWKATARSAHPLIRRYEAQRKHLVMLAVATGRTMTAMADPTTPKSQLAITAAGALGMMAVRHGDLVALVAGDAGGTVIRRPTGTRAGLEQLLRTVHARMTPQAPVSNLTRTLSDVIRLVHRRAILAVIAEEEEISPELSRAFRVLAARHEVMVITIGDLQVADREVLDADLVDVETGLRLPRYFRTDESLYRQSVADRESSRRQMRRELDRIGIPFEHVQHDSDVVPALYRLLERQRHAS